MARALRLEEGWVGGVTRAKRGVTHITVQDCSIVKKTGRENRFQEINICLYRLTRTILHNKTGSKNMQNMNILNNFAVIIVVHI